MPGDKIPVFLPREPISLESLFQLERRLGRATSKKRERQHRQRQRLAKLIDRQRRQQPEGGVP